MANPHSRPPPPRPLLFPGSDLLLLLIIVLGVSRLFEMLIGAMQSPLTPMAEEAASGGLGLTLFFLLVQNVILLAAVYMVILRPYRLRLADLGLGRLQSSHIRLGILGGLLSLPLVAMINSTVQSLQDAPLNNPQIEIFASGGFSLDALIGFLILGGVVAPFTEEIAFRGVLLGWLRNRMATAAAIFVSGFAFAVLHGIPQLVPAITVLGMVLAYLRHASNSLWPALVAHGVFNIAMTVAIYAALAQGLELG